MTKRRQLTGRLALALALAALAAGASAQDAGRAAQMGARLQERFAAADKNGDGRLSKDEARAGMPMVIKHFDEIDQGKQGSISLADIGSFARAQRAGKKGAAP